MYARASSLKSLPVISLQTGEAVAWIRQPIIDITSLSLTAFRCDLPHHKRPAILTTSDIRQLAADCVIVDSENELADPDDIVRLKPLLQTNYSPLDKSVISDLGRKLGYVEDYTINLDTNHIQQLYVRPSILRAWLSASLTIDRTQILDITPNRITVRDTTIKAPAIQTDPIPEVNP